MIIITINIIFYNIYILKRRELELVFVHNNLGIINQLINQLIKTGVLFEMALFRWNSIMHNTRPHIRESKIYSWFFFSSWKLFNYSKNMRCIKITHIALQFREGRDEGIQTKCFDFFFGSFGGEKFFQIFLGKKI